MDLKLSCPACLLAAYRVPDLQLDHLVAAVDRLRAELHADGRVVLDLKLAVSKLQHQARLPYIYVRPGYSTPRLLCT